MNRTNNIDKRLDFSGLNSQGYSFASAILSTHNQLDITGRPLTITDAKGREMMVNPFGLSEENLLTVTNIDSGKRWLLNDAADKPIRKWDERGHEFHYTYDALQRPTDTIVNAVYTERLVYGTDAAQNNIGQIKESYAQDGVSSFEYDFKGNAITQTKQFAQEYQETLDWNTEIDLSDEVFTAQTSFDALNRPVNIVNPDETTLYYGYDTGGLLVTVQRNDTEIHISNIEYNEKQQRLKITYGNETATCYTYDDKNFRLTGILTTRPNGTANDDKLQDLKYKYDAAGNITEQKDDAQQDFYFANQYIEPKGTYQYDALYRLTQATGRELTNLAMPSHEDFPNNIPCPNTDPNALQNYTQKYQYDELGNIMQMKSASNWTRDYVYQVGKNYLLKHDEEQSLPDYTYDAHGNMLSMPHLSSMEWDEKDQLHSATNGTFTSYYNYDAQGNRTRKVVEKGNIIETRYYFNGYEIFRKEVNGDLDFERTTFNIADDEKTFVCIETKTGESPVIRYQYDNHLGSACLELDDTGDIISYEEYHPFGTTSYRSGRSEIEVSLKRYKYCGKERDEETGLYYYGMRYYAAWLCRFVSVDPLQFKYPHYTPYQYAGNMPLTYTDLDGTEPDKKGEYKGQGSIAPKLNEQKEPIEGTEKQRWVWDNEQWNQTEIAITKDELSALYPKGNQDILEVLETTLNIEGSSYGIDSMEELSAFIAQTGFETQRFTRLDENLNYSLKGLRTTFKRLSSYLDKDLESIRKDSNKLATLLYGGNNKGVDYRGRGLIQTTWESNYKKASEKYNETYGTEYDFTKQPTLLSTDYLIATRSALIFFKEKGLFNQAKFDIDKISETINKWDKNSFPIRKERYQTVYNAIKLK